MPLDPEVKVLLERAAGSGAPPRSAMTVAQTREFYLGMRSLAGVPPELPRVEDRDVAGKGGPVPIRVYAPEVRDRLPVLVYFHGGRFFSGDLETHDTVCRILAVESGWMVVAVHYRLAPEHTFPAAVEDAWSVTGWLGEHAGEIGGDARRLGVGGDSAGGNLAAVTALEARAWGGPALACQLLIYPMLDATCSLRSHVTCGSGYGPGSEDMQRGYREYLPEDAGLKDPRVSPLWVSEVSNLPPAFVLTAEYDSLRDEGEQYARAMEEADVPVVLARYEGAIHGFFQLGGVLALGRKANREAAAYLRQIAAAGDG